MPGGHGSRMASAAKWLCKHCVTREGKPFLNHADKRACHRCNVSKGACFLRDVPNKTTPSTRPPSQSVTGQAGGGQNKVIKDLEKQLREQTNLTLKLKEQLDGKGGGDEEGDEDMGEDSQATIKSQLDKINKEITAILSFDSDEAKECLDKLRKKKDRLVQQLREGKPFSKQLESLGWRRDNLRNKLEKCCRRSSARAPFNSRLCKIPNPNFVFSNVVLN